MMELPAATRFLKALGDETRLRILHLLLEEELSCGDLVEILNMGQSRVSTHLTLLREVGLVRDRRAGRRSFYRVVPAGEAREVLDGVLAAGAGAPEFAADAAALGALRARRKEEARSYFDRVAADFGEEILPGRTWEGLARALIRLLPRGRYADLGIGDGLLTLMLAEVAESVTAVDHSERMLERLGTRARRAGFDNIALVPGQLDDLPLEDASHDVVILSQALHHADSPARALREARRILVGGGRVLVLDLLAHTEDWVRSKFHHRHLGFTESDLEGLMKRSGFRYVTVQRAARDPQPPHFITLVACGRAQARPSGSPRARVAKGERA